MKGATDMADFLDGEGFEVIRFLGTGRDPGTMVYGAQIFDAVAKLVEKQNVGQLVIYFSGHGVLSGGFEYWLLSGAPRDSSEAVPVWLTAGRATISGIRNVVLISDACRSPAASFGMANITGRDIFPGDHAYGTADIDVFYGTAPGEPAIEMQIDERADAYEGVYTAAFLSAFRDPPGGVISTLDDGTRVVTTEALKPYLVSAVSDALKSKPRYAQTPDALVTSKAPRYIAHVRPGPVLPGPPPSPVQRIEDLSLPAALQSGIEELSRGRQPFNIPLDAGPDNASRRAQVLLDTAIQRQRDDLLLDRAGFAVYGTDVVSYVPIGASVSTDRSENGIAIWEVGFDGHGGAVAVMFADGTGTILPVLAGFGTHVTVDEGGIHDIRFNPTGEQFMDDYLLALRGLAAEAIRAGALRFEGGQEERRSAAEAFAGTVRMQKRADPTLGLFAAYAYSNALILDGAKSVHKIMLDDLGIDLFDAAMLAGVLDNACPATKVVPPFPMLRQGWELLAAKGVTLAPALMEIRPRLTEALWTTFDADGAGQLLAIAQEGAFSC